MRTLSSPTPATSTPTEGKRRKGAAFLAVGAGVAALALSGGTFALWHATSEGSVPEIAAGQLTLDATTVAPAWHHDTMAGAVVSHVVPEDVIVTDTATTIHGVGDNLQGTLSVTLPAIDEDGFTATYQTLVNGTEYVPGTLIDLADKTASVETIITVTFDDEATATTDPVSLMDTVQTATDVTYEVDQVAK